MAKTKPKANGKAKTGDVLPPIDDQDVSVVVTDGGAVAAFIANAAMFFTDARHLEEQAKSTLIAARTLVEPTTQAADEDMQAFIRKASAGMKTVEKHWDICGVFFKMHRMLTARRGIGVQAYTDAAAIAQRHHNSYAEKERRRAAEETERRRVAAENAAREQRERELAAAEQQANDLEAASAELSDRERRFVDRLVNMNDVNPDVGLIAIGVGFKNGDVMGVRLMERPKIQAAIAAARQAKAIRTQVDAKRDAPLDVQVEIEKPAISRGGGGGYDRTAHGAECVDEAALIAAVLSGKHGIPWDVLTVNATKLNEYGRSLQERINAWPGVRHTKKTTTV
jgi:hypothetical protein